MEIRRWYLSCMNYIIKGYYTRYGDWLLQMRHMWGPVKWTNEKLRWLSHINEDLIKILGWAVDNLERNWETTTGKHYCTWILDEKQSSLNKAMLNILLGVAFSTLTSDCNPKKGGCFKRNKNSNILDVFYWIAPKKSQSGVVLNEKCRWGVWKGERLCNKLKQNEVTTVQTRIPVTHLHVRGGVQTRQMSVDNGSDYRGLISTNYVYECLLVYMNERHLGLR